MIIIPEINQKICVNSTIRIYTRKYILNVRVNHCVWQAWQIIMTMLYYRRIERQQLNLKWRNLQTWKKVSDWQKCYLACNIKNKKFALIGGTVRKLWQYIYNLCLSPWEWWLSFWLSFIFYGESTLIEVISVSIDPISTER